MLEVRSYIVVLRRSRLKRAEHLTLTRDSVKAKYMLRGVSRHIDICMCILLVGAGCDC